MNKRRRGGGHGQQWSGRWNCNEMSSWGPPIQPSMYMPPSHSNSMHRPYHQQFVPQRKKFYQPMYQDDNDLPHYHFQRSRSPFSSNRCNFINNDYRRPNDYRENYPRSERRSRTPNRFSRGNNPNQWNERRCRTPTPYEGDYSIGERRSRSLVPGNSNWNNRIRTFNEPECKSKPRTQDKNKPPIIRNYSDDEAGKKVSDPPPKRKIPAKRLEDCSKENMSTAPVPNCNNKDKVGADGIERIVVYKCRYCNTISLDEETSEKHLTTVYHLAKYKAYMTQRSSTKGK